MKSFGVRLAAGAVTILFGAYAAVLAQKDQQDDSVSWNAELPSLEEPASPIAEFGKEDWISQPVTELTDESADLLPTQPTSQGSGSIQLVQHTESGMNEAASGSLTFRDDPGSLSGSAAFAESSFPADHAVPNGLHPQDQATPNQGPDSAWLMPEFAEDQPSPSDSPQIIASPGMTMTFPDDGSFDTGTIIESDASGSVTLADSPSLEFYPAETFQSEDAVSSSSVANAGSPAAGSEIEIASVGTGSSSVPTNLLRGGPDGGNLLRGEQPSQFTDNSELAFESVSMTDGDDIAQGSSGVSSLPFAVSGPTESSDVQDITGPGSPHSLAQESITIPAAAPSYDQPLQFSSNAGLGAPQPMGAPTVSGSIPTHEISQPGLVAVPEPTAAAAIGSNVSFGSLGGNDYQPRAMVSPEAAVAIDPSETLDSPGERRLEGAQTPSVVIQKRAPAEVKVGKPAAFVVHVQNVGGVEALNVEVHDRIPAGMRLVDASPSPIQQGNLLLWQLGSMPAGDERTITVQLVPEQEGELGSVARVSFEAAASVRTIATRPELKIVQQAPSQGVLIGQQLEIALEVSNPGSGAATGVILQEDVPEGLEHPKGRQLDNALGTLAPGEVRNQVLRLRAVSPGIIENTIRLVADDGLVAEHTVAIQVVAPEIQVELAGPSKRFLERQATYQLNVANSGTADATNVEVSVQLDRGFTFVGTDYQGQYDPSRHAVFWSLAQLPAGASGSVPLTLLPVEAGEQAIKIEARADLGMIAKSERTMTVEGFAELDFAISNPGGPIEVGAETTYEVRVTNTGSKADDNVRVQMQLPSGLELVSTDGEAGTDGRGLVAFQPRSQLAPGQEMKFNLRVRGVAPGTHVVRAVVVSDQSTVPVTKEESTRVYADQ